MFLIFGQLMLHPLTELFHLSSLCQIPNDRRMVDVEFFGNFSCTYKRISSVIALSWSLSASDGQPLCSSSSRLLSPLQNLNHHCTVCSLASSSWAKYVVDVTSCFRCFTTHFELELKKSLKFAFCLTSFP